MSRDKAGEERAREAAQRAMSSRGYSVAGLAREANVDPGTVGDFVAGRRWPRREKLAAIERALMLAPGTLAQIAEGGEAEPTGTRSAPRSGRPTAEQGRAAAETLQFQLHPGLRRFTDAELLHEIEVRQLFYAARLTFLGEPSLNWRVSDDGGDEMVSGPPVNVPG